jgi:NADH:ubiquinone oxidoreductase subunit E
VEKERKMEVAEKDKKQELKEFIDSVKDKEHGDSYLIAVLHKAQGLYGYLSREVMDTIAQQMQIPTAHIWGVATFYHYFNLTPPGKYVVSVCLGTACYVKGAPQILEAVKNDLKIDLGGITEDRLFSLQLARCLGACGVAPVVMVGDKIHGEMTPKKVVEVLNQYRKAEKKQ